MPTPEEKAREIIDQLLVSAGWTIQDRTAANLDVAGGLDPARHLQLTERVPKSSIAGKRAFASTGSTARPSSAYSNQIATCMARTESMRIGTSARTRDMAMLVHKNWDQHGPFLSLRDQNAMGLVQQRSYKLLIPPPQEQNIHTTPEFLNHFHMGTAVTLQIPMGVGWSVTDFDEGSRLRYLKEAGICPNCGKKFPEGTAVVWGLGAFCSLECVAQFNQAEFSERARRLQAAARN